MPSLGGGGASVGPAVSEGTRLRRGELIPFLASCHQRRTSGLLAAERNKLKRLFCIERGALTHAMSNILEEQFSERLVRDRILTPSDREVARQEADRSGKRIGEVILAAGFAGADTLQDAMRAHVLELLQSTLEWPDGEFRFDDGRPNLGDDVKSTVPLASIVLDDVRRRPGRLDEVRMRIGPPDTRLVRSRRAERLLQDIPESTSVRYILEHCDDSHPISSVSQDGPEGEGPAYRAAYGLLLLGVLEPLEAKEAATGGVLPDVTEAELDGWIAKARDTDHYTVLGVDARATAEELRTAYYVLARRLHPDRFRSGDMKNRLRDAEEFFTKVTEAYNTLADVDSRAEYDTFRAELAARVTDDEQQDTAYLARQNFARARMLIEKRRYVDAVGFLENAIKLDDGVAEYHRTLGLVLARNPRMRADAERSLRRTIEIDPSGTRGYLALGELLAKAGRTDEAIRAFEEALTWEADLIVAKQAVRALQSSGKAEDLADILGDQLAN